MEKETTGKELITLAFSHKKVPRIPFVPLAGIHAGKLVGYSASELLQDANKLIHSQVEVNNQFHPDGQPVVFDLQIEAEILGCELRWDDHTPPSVASHPYANHDALPTKLPEKSDGRIPIVLESMHALKEKIGEHTALFGLLCGPLTLASHLRGTNLFMDMITHPEYVTQLLDYCTEVSERMIDLYAETGMDVLSLVDPVVSQISPTHFTQFLHKPYSQLFAYIKQLNPSPFSSFFVCGDASKNIEVMCLTKPDVIAIDENIDLNNAKKITDSHTITLMGNIPLTSVMLHGTQQDNMLYALRILDSIDPHNFVLAPGCDMPYDIPVENTIGISETVRNPEKVRELLKTYKAVELDMDVPLPNYHQLTKPLIEVFTIDSDTCAACTYMWKTAMEAKKQYGNAIETIEYRITEKENIARVKKMGIKNLPCMVINGELKFSSIIPRREELFASIDDAMQTISNSL